MAGADWIESVMVPERQCAGAGTTTAFHSMPGYPNRTDDDSQVGNIAWIEANANGQTSPVGQRAGNGFGLHDVSGNVWEWVNDPPGAYPSAAQVDAVGPASGSSRVIRGGSWRNLGANSLRSSYREWGSPGVSDYNYGFHVARNP